MRWAWFRKRADAIIGSTGSAEYQSIVDEINRLSDLSAARSGRRRVPVPIRRALADLHILAAHKKRRPIGEGESLFLHRSQVGFPTLADEAIAVASHARYCRQVGETALAANYAVGVLKKIE